MSRYTDLVLKEIDERHSHFTGALDSSRIDTLYFGGGTPSLLDPDDIVAIIKKLNNVGLEISQEAEITIEINPGTISPKKLDLYRAHGVNRFSVGVQTFDDAILKKLNREHSADDSRKTLLFLKQNTINYSFDLLFGLPGQSLAGLTQDLEELKKFSPPHVSAYLMTIPEGHPLNQGRAADSTQAEMFHLIDHELAAGGWDHYEISNYARPGYESRHNLGYWNDQPYWGLGLSAHSYMPMWGTFGARFWNNRSLRAYAREIEFPLFSNSPDSFLLPTDQVEVLEENEALTDFLHTQLRKKIGLSELALRSKFPLSADLALARLESLYKKGWVRKENAMFSLTPEQRVTANAVFLELTFLKTDLGVDRRG